MTYRVGHGNIEVSDDVYDSLAKATMGGDVPMLNESDEDSAEAFEGFLVIFEKRMQWIGNMRLKTLKNNPQN